jgi:glycosyltransferase involved in cell wall biosynthesis
MSRRVMLVANSDWYLFNFRRSLAEALRDGGCEVTLVSPPGEYVERLEQLGFRWVDLDLAPRGTNPFVEFSTMVRFLRLFVKERPHLVHLHTIKCVLYGTIAARVLGPIAVVASVTGLGHAFHDPARERLQAFLRRLYRYAFGHDRLRVIFQNDEDRDRLVYRGDVEEAVTTVIRGSGVDVERFRPRPSTEGPRVRFLFGSRMLKEKGVVELAEAASRLVEDGLPVEFTFAGSHVPGTPSALRPDELDSIRSQPHVRWLGHVEDMPGLLAESDVVVLPSHGEGTPRILLEAAAMEKPIVASDVAGCRGPVEHEVNGLLVPPRDVDSLETALRRLAGDAELRRRMGAAGREIAVEQFSESSVIERTLAIYRTFGIQVKARAPVANLEATVR